MTPEQWHKVKEVFEAALEHVPSERTAFVSQACAGDESVRSEVRSLLSSYEQESGFMESPAVALAAQAMIKEERALRSLVSSSAVTKSSVSLDAEVWVWSIWPRISTWAVMLRSNYCLHT